jgi:hypothetical protein
LIFFKETVERFWRITTIGSEWSKNACSIKTQEPPYSFAKNTEKLEIGMRTPTKFFARARAAFFALVPCSQSARHAHWALISIWQSTALDATNICAILFCDFQH